MSLHDLELCRVCGLPRHRHAVPCGRKPYASPAITEYGTLSDITGSSANAGMLDGDPFGLKTSGRV